MDVGTHGLLVIPWTDYLGGLSAGNGGIAGSDAAGVQGHWGAASTHPALGGKRWDLQSSPSGAWVKVRGQVEGVSGGCQAEEVMEACLGTTAQRTGGLGSEQRTECGVSLGILRLQRW